MTQPLCQWPNGANGHTNSLREAACVGDEIADLRLWLEAEVRERLLAMDAKLMSLSKRLDAAMPLGVFGPDTQAPPAPPTESPPTAECRWPVQERKVREELVLNGAFGTKHRKKTLGWKMRSNGLVDPPESDEVPDEKVGYSTVSIPRTTTNVEVLDVPEIDEVPPMAEPSQPKPLLSERHRRQASDQNLSAGSSSSGSRVLQEFASPNDALITAVKDGKVEDVERALLLGGDPNVHLSQFKIMEAGGKEFSEGTPLAVAVLRSNKDMIRKLLEFRADPDSTYAFHAGATGMECTLPASHATVALGDLSILELLVEAKTDLNAEGSNKANLMWQAAYFGQVEFLRYLLTKKVKTDEPAISQDNVEERHTPLHTAARQGHKQVVSMLLDTEVRVSGAKGALSTPLEDAIIAGHGQVVQILVAKGGRLFGKTKFSHDFISKGIALNMGVQLTNGSNQDVLTSTDIPLNVLFEKGNSVVIAKAALGLMKASSNEIDKLTAEHLLWFLKTPGKAPVEILRAAFRKHTIRYWEGMKRRVVKTSLMDPSVGFNVCEGPSYQVINRLFNTKAKGKEMTEFMTFREALAPQPKFGMRSQEQGHGKNLAFVDVDLYMCHVQGVSGNMEVLWALADQRDIEVFAEIGCRVMVHLHWTKVKKSATLLIIFEIIYLVLFCTLNVMLRELPRGFDEQDQAPLSLQVVAGMCLVASGLELLNFIAWCVGCYMCGLKFRPVTIWSGLDLARLTAAALLLTDTLIRGLDVREDTTFKFTLGMLIFLRWLRTLEAFTALRSIGLRILPIMSTMWAVGPFVGVLLMYMSGCVSAYYALGLKDMFDSFMIVFRIVVMGGEVEMGDLENVNPKMEEIPNSTDYEMVDGDRTSFYLPVRLLLIITSFFLGLSLTNVFIAVLCISYEKASKQATNGFTQTLANIVIDHHTRKVGLRRMFLCEKPVSKSITRTPTSSYDIEQVPATQSSHPWRRRANPGSTQGFAHKGDAAVSNTSLESPHGEEDMTGFIWYTVPQIEDN